MAACVSMSLISDVPLHGFVSFYLSVHRFLDTWVVFLLGLSGITLLWTCMCKSLCGPKLSFPSGVYLRVELLGRVVTNSVFNSFGNCRLLSEQLPYFPFPPAAYEGSEFSTSLPTLATVCLSDHSGSAMLAQ